MLAKLGARERSRKLRVMKRLSVLLWALACASELFVAAHAIAQDARTVVDHSVFGIVVGEALPALAACVPDTALPQPGDANCLKRELARAPQDPISPLYAQHFVGVSTEIFDTDALAPNPLEGMQVWVSLESKRIENVLLIAELRDRRALLRTLTQKYGAPQETESTIWLRDGERVRMPVKVWRFSSLVVRFLGDPRQRLGVLEVSSVTYEQKRAAQEGVPHAEDPALNAAPKPRRSL